MTTQTRADSFLQLIRRAERGRLKVYLGYCPGVGKTYRMLQEAHQLKAEQVDVVVGVVETHGRSDTGALLGGLEIVPRRHTQYRDVPMDEMDLEAILVRKPYVVLVDELAHTNLPDSKNAKRYQDVQDLLAAGIHVISTLNLQHLESLYDTVEKLVGVKVTERLPDSVLAEADQVVNVDITPEDLHKRLQAGKVYEKDRAVTALNHFFTAGNLEQLRELTLREVASQIDLKRREVLEQERKNSPDQVMVCLSSKGPSSSALLRYGSRLAGRLNRNWYAVYVQTPSEDPIRIDATTQRHLADSLTLANQLGAMVFTFRGEDVVETILRFAREYRVGHVVIGRPSPIPMYKRLLGNKSVAERLIHEAQGVSVVVIDAVAGRTFVEGDVNTELKPAPVSQAPPANGRLGSVLDPQRVLIWRDPVSQNQILEHVAEAAATAANVPASTLLKLLQDRERQGSTALNEGIALPHAKVAGLEHPVAVMGLTHGGMTDGPADKRIEIVFGLLSPEGQPEQHLKLLAAAARALRDRNVRASLERAETPEEAHSILLAAES